MAKLRAFLIVSLAVGLTGSAMAGQAAKPSSKPSTKGQALIDHIPQLDGPMTTVASPDGRTWAAWSYRAAGEFDIAVSSAEAGSSTWSAPTFFGRRSGSDEVDPAIVVDSRGAVYLAFALSNPTRVALSILIPGARSWTEPFVVSGPEVASSPALMLVGDRLIVAFRTAHAVRMVVPTIASDYQIEGVQDGPDGVDPLGAKGGRDQANNPGP